MQRFIRIAAVLQYLPAGSTVDYKFAEVDAQDPQTPVLSWQPGAPRICSLYVPSTVEQLLKLSENPDRLLFLVVPAKVRTFERIAKQCAGSLTNEFKYVSEKSNLSSIITTLLFAWLCGTRVCGTWLCGTWLCWTRDVGTWLCGTWDCGKWLCGTWLCVAAIDAVSYGTELLCLTNSLISKYRAPSSTCPFSQINGVIVNGFFSGVVRLLWHGVCSSLTPFAIVDNCSDSETWCIKACMY